MFTCSVSSFPEQVDQKSRNPFIDFDDVEIMVGNLIWLSTYLLMSLLTKELVKICHIQ